MRDQEIVGLWEAYQQVYDSQEFTEEVEIATQYFYEMGLNEDGVNILIEELGVEEFVDWVYEIAEDYTLTEARAGGSRIEPVTKGGKSVGELKGGAKTAAINRLRKEKSARKRAEEESSSSKSSGMRDALRSQASKSASTKQKPEESTPTKTKKGIGGLIGAAVERAKQDTALLKKTIDTARGVATRRGAEAAAVYTAARQLGKKAEQSPQVTRARRKATVTAGRAAQAVGKTAIKAAGAAGAAAGAGVSAHRQGKTGAQIAGRAAGTFVKKMIESYDLYDIILLHLLDEGYAETIESAEAIMVNMSEEWRESIVEAKVER